MVKLRDYQAEAIRSAVAAARGGARRITIASPVGSGKSVIMSELARMAKRPIVLSPSRTLLSQLHGNLELWLGERVGVEQGANRVEDIVGLKERVAVCMRQSMMSRDRYRRRAFDGTTLVIVDECHLGNTKPFMRMMAHFEAMGAVAVGLSATPYKGRGKPLPFWDRPCFSYSLLDAIRDGYLVRPRGVISRSTSIDLSAVEVVANDWREDQLNAVLEAEHAVQEISSLVLQTYRGRPSAVYCNSVFQAKLLAEVFTRYGVTPSLVFSDQPDEERQANMDAFTSGRTKIICNVGILAYGWDFPRLMNIYNAAPTMSLAVYEQRIGRGTRPLAGTLKDGMTKEERLAAIAASDKPHFTIYDITDASDSIQLVNALDLLDAASRENPERRQRGMGALATDAKPADDAESGADVLEVMEDQDRIEEFNLKRQRLLVGVDFSHRDRDLFSSPAAPATKQRGWRMIYGQHKGKLVRDLPTTYLEAVLRKAGSRSYGKSAALHSAIRSEIHRRQKA